jgi:hypothetical protein
MMDVTSLVITGVDGIHNEQAKLTFAMARHAAVDLSQVIYATYNPHVPSRLDSANLQQMRKELAQRGVTMNDAAGAEAKLAQLRSLYEPYVHSLSRRLFMTVPPWRRPEYKKDNWQGGPWDRAIQAQALERPGRAADDHF